MTWFGMSIPTLPGSLKRPRAKHPGSRNIEESEEEESPNPEKPANSIKKPSINPAPKQKSPKTPVRKPLRKGD